MSLSLILATALAFDPAGCHQGDVAKAIEARRLEFNEAIASGDLSGIEGVLAEHVILVTGTWSERFAGREEQIEIWAQDFAQGDQRMIYTRTPRCIRSSKITSMATEYGQWLGSQPNGAMASGSYTAKWRLIEDRWQLEAEIFMTEACGGSACPD